MDNTSTWLLLVLTLPTENATARMRFWRALKAKGCAVLRDGVYLFPFTDEHEAMLRELTVAIADSGGTAHLLRAHQASTRRRKRNFARCSIAATIMQRSFTVSPKPAKRSPANPPPN